MKTPDGRHWRVHPSFRSTTMNTSRWGMAIAVVLGAVLLTANAQEQADRTDKSHRGFFKGSSIIGMEVRGTDNQDLGEVQDILVDRDSSEIQYIILDTGVLADLDGKQPIIPWMLADMKAGAEANTHFLSVPLTQDRIKTAPTIVLTDADLASEPTWVTKVHDFYDAEMKERRVSRPDLDRGRTLDKKSDVRTKP
jgi:hypothetical protein